MERISAFLFLLLIPTQLGKHFWPEWSKVMGMRVDYLSPTLYLLDILWLLVFGLSKRKEKIFWWIGVLMILNVWVAEYRWLAIYKWLRVGQMVWMAGYLRRRKKWVKENLKQVLPVWIVFESLLGLAQMIKGGSLGGWLYWLGERRFSYMTLGVAQISVMGRGLVRAYGTFSHPNSLAGFMLVAVLWWFKYKEGKGNKLMEIKVGRFVCRFDWGTVWWWMVLWSGVMGIILAGSRMVWLTAVVLLIVNLKWQVFSRLKWKKLGWGLLLLFGGVFVMVMAGVSLNYVVGDFLGGWDRAGLIKRAGLNWSAIKMIKDNLLMGTGLGNFLVELPAYQKSIGFYWLQPVHNIILLGLCELGLVGVWIIWRQVKKLKWLKLKIVEKSMILVVLVTGMMDHYWLTLPQNNWILVVFLAVLLR